MLIRYFLGAATLVLGSVSYAPYFRDVFRGKTKPHAFSWLVWGTLSAVGFGIGVTNGGGPGAWQLGFSVVACTAIFFLALQRGEKDIRRSDWACLAGSAVAGVLWLVVDSAVLSVILITVIDGLGFIPTFRKSYQKPWQETLSTQVIGCTRHGLSLLALSSVSLATALYPFSLFAVLLAFSLFLIIRRRQLGVRPETAESIAPEINEELIRGEVPDQDCHTFPVPVTLITDC